MTSKPQIPVLTDAIGADRAPADERGERAAARILREDSEIVVDAAPAAPDTEMLIAELQTRLAAAAFDLTDAVLRKALADIEANLHEQISARLRRELPELVDGVLREHLQGRNG
jgi:hypothetical protein